MTTLTWEGEYAYMKAFSAKLTLNSGSDYTFRDDSNRAQVIQTGSMGQYVSRDERWVESNRNRLLAFGFYPKRTTDRTLTSDANRYGWTLTGIDARDNNEDDIRWSEARMDHRYKPTQIAVPTSSQLFICEEFSAGFMDIETGDVLGTFTATNIVLGAYLPSNYNPNSLDTYNPCTDFNGQTCSAEDGVIYCGGQIYDPEDPYPEDVHLEWYGPNSYLDVRDATATLDDIPSFYSFQDYQDRSLVIESGTYGKTIQREADWAERHSGSNYVRKLRFSFRPIGNNLNNELANVRDSGYRIYRVQMYDNDQNWMVWEDTASSLGVPEGFDYFYCDQIEFDFKAGYKFMAWSSEIGGYLEDNYRPSRLVRYDPCVEANRDGPCRALDGVIFCNNRVLNPDFDRTPSPTPSPTRTRTGVDLEWEGAQAYLSAENAEATLSSGNDYVFEDDQGREFWTYLNTGSDGRYLATEQPWVEGGKERAMYFRAKPKNSSGDKPYTLYEVKMRDNNGDWIYWVVQDVDQSFIKIPELFDAFFCEYVEFSFGSNQGTFKADNFVFGNYLNKNYDTSSLDLFNPCEYVEESDYDCQGNKICSCSIVDDSLTCNGKQVSYDELYGRDSELDDLGALSDVAPGAPEGISPSSAAPMGAGTSRAATMFLASVVVGAIRRGLF